VTDAEREPPVAKPPSRLSFRWEPVFAIACQFMLWVEVSLLYPLRGLPPGERFLRLRWAIPWMVLTPALAVSALRNRRANKPSRVLAWAVLLLCLATWPFWYAVMSLLHLFSTYPPWRPI
jgi:hypothetical protein